MTSIIMECYYAGNMPCLRRAGNTKKAVLYDNFKTLLAREIKLK